MRWVWLIVLLVACGGPAAPAAAPAEQPAPGSMYSEDFALPTRDRRDVALTARARIRIRPEREADLASYGGEDWYWTHARPELRAAVRYEVQRRDLAELQRDDAAAAAAAALERLRARFTGTPFELVTLELVRIRER